MILLSKNKILETYYDLMKKFGGLSGIRSEEALDYSIDSINARVFNTELYPTIIDKACRLCFNLVMNHPFHDGNKRIGYYCLITTLEFNGLSLDLNNEEVINMVYNLAGNDEAKLEYEEFLQIIKKHVIFD